MKYENVPPKMDHLSHRKKLYEVKNGSYVNQPYNNQQLLDEVEQNIVICQQRADQLFAEAVGRGK